MTPPMSEWLRQEWRALHRDVEAIERSTVWIKLAAMGLSLVALALAFDTLLTLLLLAVLWLQEAIVRTGQSRLAQRLITVEAGLRGAPEQAGQAFQLYSAWTDSRPGTVGLVREYLAHAVRPTVAFPYVVLGLLLWAVSTTV